MKDRYFLKKGKVVNLLFDLVKYLLTTLGAIAIIGEKPLSFEFFLALSLIALIIFMLAVVITPAKEE